MLSPLSYRPDVEQVITRMRRLYDERSQDIVLASMQLPSKALEEFTRSHPAEVCEYPDINERAVFWDAYLKERIPIRDDSIPSAYLSELDQGLYGGLVGGDVRFLCIPDKGCISSMISPLLDDLAEFESLSFREDCKWFQRYIHQLEVFVKASDGKFGISHFTLINGLNFIFELIGATKAYIELIDRPELATEVIDFAFDLNSKIHQVFFDTVPLVEEGTCSNMAQWVPGRIVSESIDPFHMTSEDFFEQHGRGPVERILSKFDGGVLHIHGIGRHLLEAASTIKGLKAIRLLDDAGVPPAFQVLRELKRRSGSMPLIVNVEFPDFWRALHDHVLTSGVLYHITGVPDIDTANRCMDLVRALEV